MRASFAALLVLLAACEPVGGDDRADGAGPLDVVAPPKDALAADGDASGPPPTAAPARHYRIDDGASTCLAGIPDLDPCTEWWTAGALLLVRWDDVDLEGGIEGATLRLDRVTVGPRTFTDCRATPIAGDGYTHVEFTCAGEGGDCALVLDEDPDCAPPTPDVVAHPMVDLAQIAAISRYNGCAGHGYGCPFLDACPGSLKTYLVPRAELYDTNDAVAVYSPCDGVVSSVAAESHRLPCYGDAPQGTQVAIQCTLAPSVEVRLFHIAPSADVAPGLAVTAGAPLGFADLRLCFESSASFDVAIQNGYGGFLFDYATPEVLAAWREWGLEDPWTEAQRTDAERGTCDFSAGPQDADYFPEAPP